MFHLQKTGTMGCLLLPGIGFLAIVRTVASVAGVVFSWLAWVQAKGAKEAAIAAADAVRIRNLTHNISRWAMDARDLLKSVRDLEFQSAQRSATDLLGALSHNKGWQVGLRREAPVIEEVVRLLSLVNTYLTDRTLFENRQSSLAEECQTIYRRLNEVAGSLDAQAEKL